MILDPNWRILTIGDGDLSFSWSLFKHHNPKRLVATVYDQHGELERKYDDQYYHRLKQVSCPVLTGIDVTNPETWDGLKLHSFDLVIFQFPLIPGFSSKKEYQQWQGYSVNTANRYLLNRYLHHSFSQFLDPQGARLAYISSKDVKPYNEWDIERALHLSSGAEFLGKSPFVAATFPEYRIRNVDRDKWVKETSGFTYVWSDNPPPNFSAALLPAKKLTGEHCPVCLAGPFATEQESLGHYASKRHKLLTDFHQQWQQYALKHNLGSLHL